MKKSISVSLNNISGDTIKKLETIPGVDSVVEVFPNHMDAELKCMLIVYTEQDPYSLARMISGMDNIKYAQTNPTRKLL